MIVIDLNSFQARGSSGSKKDGTDSAAFFIVFRTQLDQPPHDEVLEVPDLPGRQIHFQNYEPKGWLKIDFTVLDLPRRRGEHGGFLTNIVSNRGTAIFLHVLRDSVVPFPVTQDEMPKYY